MAATRNLLHCLTALAGLFLVYWYGFTDYLYGGDRWLQVFALIGLFRLNGLTGPWTRVTKSDSWWYAAGLFAVIAGLLLNYFHLKEGYMLMVVGAIVILVRQFIDWIYHSAYRGIRSILLIIYIIGLVYILQYRQWVHFPFERGTTLLVFNLLIFLTLLGGGIYGLVLKPKPQTDLSDRAIDFPDREV